ETGGGLLKAGPLLKDAGLFITLNADILTNLDLSAFINFHKERNPLVSLAVTRRESSRYLLLDRNLRLTGWRNVKTGEQKMSVRCDQPLERAFSGIAIYRPETFSFLEEMEHLKKKEKVSIIEVYLGLAKEHAIAAFDHTGDTWLDVGKPGSIEHAE